MSKNRSPLLVLALAAVALGALTACSSMLETTPYEWSTPVSQQRCGAGAYYLPRRLLTFEVSAPDGTSGRNELQNISTVPASDRRLALCLDYLAAPTADDKLVIDRSADGLLNKIMANAEDKSLEIAQAAIDVFRHAAVATAAPRSTSVLKFGSASPLAGKFEMDPFDVPESAAINNSLKDMGYCVFVDGFTFDPGRFSPETYCRNPLAAIAPGAPRTPPIDRETVMSESRRGVLYRPNLPHRVVVMRNINAPKPGRWRLQQTLAFDMPNVSPIFSVGVDRAFFTDRKTTLAFESGVLKDVQLTKGSELNSIVEVPLRVAQAITAIPAQIVQVRINRINNEEALINAQAKLLATMRDFRNEQKQLVDFQKNLTSDGRNRLQCLQVGGSEFSPAFDACMKALAQGQPVPSQPPTPPPPPPGN